jgi:nitronate monooxygenase
MIPNPMSADEVEDLVGHARRRTSKPIGVGFLIPFVVREAVEAAGRTADVVEFFYGDPDPTLVELARRGGAIVDWQVGSASEAVAAVTGGCDFVVVQGVEAGGHIRGNQLLDEILRETLDAVEVPVVAAGGIGTPDRVAQLLAAGADAVRIGTRFVAAEESDAHPRYVEKLIGATRKDTIISGAFRAEWPDAPHRVLKAAVEAAETFEGDVIGNLRGGWEVPRFSSMPPTRHVEGEVLAMAMYAGESVDAVKNVKPAKDIVAELIPQATRSS